MLKGRTTARGVLFCFVLSGDLRGQLRSTNPKLHLSEEKYLSDEKITPPGPWKFSISYLGKDSCFTCIAKKSGSHSQKRRGLFPGSRNGAFSLNQPACTWYFVARTVRYTYCGVGVGMPSRLYFVGKECLAEYLS